MNRYSAVMSTLALVVALTFGGAYAAGVKIGSKQIRNGSVRSVDLKNGGVDGVDIENDTVDSPDIASDSVTPEEAAFPEPVQCHVAGQAAIDPTTEYQKLATICQYNKTAADSVLDVGLTAAVTGKNGGEVSGCQFQLRLNGQPSTQGGGEEFGKGITTINPEAFFPGLTPGLYNVEVWAKVNIPNAAENLCAINPDAAGMAATVDVNEVAV